MTDTIQIAAIVAAAGCSTRMGVPKQLLPWGDGTVLSTVVSTLTAAGTEPIVCVLGHRQGEMRGALRNSGAQIVYNQAYAEGDMLASYQAGIAELQSHGLDDCVGQVAGALLALGDQPHVPVGDVRAIIEQARESPASIVMPSFAMRRGHPFYLPRRLWQPLMSLCPEQSLRTLINREGPAIRYVNVDSDAVLTDMDTLEQYEALLQRHQKGQDEKGQSPPHR